jgi:hypothetical protein
MRFSINANRIFYFAFFALMFVGLLVFPISHSGDGYGYAADSLQYKHDLPALLSPHHLLYLPWCNFFLPLWQSMGIDPLAGFTALNMIFCFGILETIRTWLMHYQVSESLTSILQWIVLGSFGLLRFALENETYIMPLFLALLGSYLLEVKSKSQANNLLGWSLLCLSVLFHQSYVFWLTAYMLKSLRNKQFMQPLLSVALVIGTYVWAAHITESPSLWSFVFHDVESGLVETRIGIKHAVFFTINLVRTLFQVHGNCLDILLQWRFLGLIGVGGLLLSLVSIFRLIKTSFVNRSQPLSTRLKIFKPCVNEPLFWAMMLHMAFAFYSVGNAEFMIMLFPLLVILWAKLNQKRDQSNLKRPLTGIGLGLWVYHFVFVLSPLFLCSFDDSGKIAKAMIQSSSNIAQNDDQNDPIRYIIISNQAKAIENAHEYFQRKNGQVIRENTLFYLPSSDNDVQKLSALIQQHRTAVVITDDSYMLPSNSHVSRAGMSNNPAFVQWIQQLHWNRWKAIDIASPRRKIQLYQLKN